MANIKTLAACLLAAGASCAADLDAVARYEFGADPSAVRDLLREAERATPAEAAALEQKLVPLLKSGATPAGKDAACRALSLVGSAAAVPSLAALLADDASGAIALYALERIPAKESSIALRKALPAMRESMKVGLVNALGRRRDIDAVPLLAPLLSSPTLAEPAAAALASIGRPAARQALLASKSVPAHILLGVAGQSPAPTAIKVYKEIYATSKLDAERVAALSGLARLNAAGPLVAQALDTGTPAVRAEAIKLLAPGALVTAWPKLPEAAKVQALVALSAHPAQVSPLLKQALVSDSEVLRVAALESLERAGSAADVQLLAAKAAAGSPTEQAAARSSLARLRGPDVDTGILAGLAKAQGKEKIELIRASGERGITAASTPLLDSTADASPAVRRESIRALREIAGPAHVDALLARMMASDDDSDRDEYGRAVAAAIRRGREARVTPLLNAWSAAKDPDARAALLPVFSLVGSPESLPVMRQALAASDADVVRAALNALGDWPSPEAAADVIAFARTTANPAQQVLALRAYLKLVQLPVERSSEESTKLLAAAYSIAPRPEEKKAVLAALQRVHCREALELARSAVKDPAVAAEAKRAAEAIERGMSFGRR